MITSILAWYARVIKIETQAELYIGELFNDRRHIIYVNGAYEGDSEIGRLMHDFRCSNPDDMYYEPMKKKAKYCPVGAFRGELGDYMATPAYWDDDEFIEAIKKDIEQLTYDEKSIIYDTVQQLKKRHQS